MKRKMLIFVAFIIAVAVLLIIKGNLRTQSTHNAFLDTTMDVEAEYGRLKNSGRPSIIVFYYESDCCTNTKEYYEEYKKRAIQLLKDNNRDLGTLFINTIELTEAQGKAVQKIAEENGITAYPSILLLDSNGEPAKIINGFFENKTVNVIINGLVIN